MDEGIKGSVSRTLVWPCPVPDQHSLSSLLIQFLSTYLLGEELSLLCMCVYRGLNAATGLG